MEPGIVCIAVFTNRQEAELARSALVANHLDAVIAADDGGGAVPGMDYTHGVRVFVREEDVEAAREILGS
jgi:hypothetical protein